MIDTIARGRRVYDRHYIVYAASSSQVASLSWAYTRTGRRGARLSVTKTTMTTIETVARGELIDKIIA